MPEKPTYKSEADMIEKTGRNAKGERVVSSKNAGTQKIKTYYEENKKQEEFLQHHKERADSNRKQRDDARKNRPLKEKIHDTLGRGGRKVKEFAEPIINNLQNLDKEPKARKGRASPKGYNNPLANMRPDTMGFPNINPMAMGMNSPGIAGPPAWMMGMGQPEPEPVKRRKPRKRKPQQQRQPRQQVSYTDLGGIPPEVRRWMI